MLATLSARHFRNLTAARLSPLATHNIIFGSNGSGKTSLLEAAHILGTARSFRSGRAKAQIQHGQSSYVVHGDVRGPGGRSRSLGVQRHGDGEVVLRVSGESTRSVASLADELPLLVINSDSFDLLVGDPGHRRRFMDWGVFHVEHVHREARQRFQRALSQRNMLLRRGRLDPVELEVWTRDLVIQGEAVAEARAAFIQSLENVFQPLLASLAPDLGDVKLSYRRGWDARLSYADALERGLATDREQGFTHSGPQRADIRVAVDGHPAAETLSRGQQKLLVTAMKLAQGQLLANHGAEVLFLIDDLPSELDAQRCERVCRLLGQMPVQTMVTCVSPEAVPPAWFGAASAAIAMFHVKHGDVAPAAAQTESPDVGRDARSRSPDNDGDTP